MAMTNIALDLVGQTRNIFQVAARIQGDGAAEDSIAYTRDATAYKNILLVEQKNGDFAKTVTRQFFYDAFNFHAYQRLLKSSNTDIAAIAAEFADPADLFTNSIKNIIFHGF